MKVTILYAIIKQLSTRTVREQKESKQKKKKKKKKSPVVSQKSIKVEPPEQEERKVLALG